MTAKTIKILACVLFLLLVILPGSKAGFFNGLPLSAPETIFSILIILAIFVTPWEQIKRIKMLVITGLLFFLIFQAISYFLLPYGWSVCVLSDNSKIPLATRCEPTLENPKGDLGYIYTVLNFNEKNMPLYFFNNTASFGYYRKGDPKRNTLPFNINAFTFIDSREGKFIQLKSSGDLSVKINDTEYEYQSMKKIRPMILQLEPDKINRVEIQYRSTLNTDKRILEVTTDGQPFYSLREQYPENFVHLYRAVNYVLLLILGACFAYSYFLLYMILEKKYRIIILALGLSSIFLAILAVTRAISFKMVIVYFNLAALFASVLFVFLKEEARKKMLTFIFIVILANASILVTCRVLPEEAQILAGGDDELTHESFARKFIPVSNIDEFMFAAGEEVFYYQPLHRYFLFALHKFFGEPMWGPYVIQLVLYNMAILLIIYTLRKSFGSISTLTFIALYLTLFALNASHNIVRMLISPLQQAIALPFLMIGVSLIFLSSKAANIRNYFPLAIGMLLGSAFMMRTDWFPVIAFLILLAIYVLWINSEPVLRLKRILFLIIGFAIFSLFIGYRNYYVAHQFSIFTTSTFVNLTPRIYAEVVDKVEIRGSSVPVIKEIFNTFSGRYRELGGILWSNVNRDIIGISVFQKLLWYMVLPLFALSAFIGFKKRNYSQITIRVLLLISLASMIGLASFFKQHNGLAMTAIYNILLILIISLSLQNILESWKKLKRPLWKMKTNHV